MRKLKFILTCFYLTIAWQLTCPAHGFAAEEIRVNDVGYILKTGADRFFFVRNPRVLDPGVEIKDEQVLKNGYLCVLKRKSLPLECPAQEISFRLEKKQGSVVLSDARLVTETEWHRLNRAEKRFTE